MPMDEPKSKDEERRMAIAMYLVLHVFVWPSYIDILSPYKHSSYIYVMVWYGIATK